MKSMFYTTHEVLQKKNGLKMIEIKEGEAIDIIRGYYFENEEYMVKATDQELKKAIEYKEENQCSLEIAFEDLNYDWAYCDSFEPYDKNYKYFTSDGEEMVEDDIDVYYLKRQRRSFYLYADADFVFDSDKEDYKLFVKENKSIILK